MPVPESFRDRPYAAKRFGAIVDRVREENPFYRRWIADPENVPIIDRETYLAHNDEILNGHPVTGSTSGSTGVPVRYSQSSARFRRALQVEAEFIESLGGRLPRILLVYSGGGEKAGPDLLDVKSPIGEQIDFILRRREEAGAEAIITYPTNAEMLAREAIERGIDFSFITRFGMMSESVEDHQLERIALAFPRARIWSSYSALEFGPIALPCPHQPGFHHIDARNLGVEILDDQGRPAAMGERGRVVITDYFNRQSPFIRYEIGDYAVPGVCPCGRIPFPALSRIIGKVRGALLHRDGRRVLFTDLSVALRDLPGMRQYQVIQETVDRFTVRVVGPESLDPAVRGALRAHFGYDLEIGIEHLDTIPREPNGKFHASICRI